MTEGRERGAGRGPTRRGAGLLLALSLGLIGCSRTGSLPPAVGVTPGARLEAEAGPLTVRPSPQAVAEPRSGGRVIADPDASGGRAVALLGTNDNVVFVVPSTLPAGRYSVSVRGRGDEYRGWPTVDLNDARQRRLAVTTLDSATYVTRKFGDFDLTPGQVFNLSFIDDLYDGPGRDRNAIVDQLLIEPAVTAPPAHRPPTVTLRPPGNGDLTGASISTYEDEHNVTLEADASDPDGSVARVEFFLGDVKIGEDTTAPYRMIHSQERDQPLASPTPASYWARATDDQGAVTTSAPVEIVTRSRGYDPQNPLPLRAINFAGPATAVNRFHCPFCLNGVFFGAGDGGSWTTNGTAQAGNVAPVPPLLSPEREALVRGGVSRPEGGLELKVPVPSAAYEVYLWVRAEDATPYGIGMEGRSVSRFDPGEAGRWDRLGPFPVTVEDGVLDVASTGTAPASFSAIEVWRVRRPGETPPTVAFDPLPDPFPYPGTALALNVTASSPNGRIEKVEFYAKGPSPSSRALNLGEDTSAPFTLGWQNAPAGSYAVIARATDSGGLSSTTETRVIVQAP